MLTVILIAAAAIVVIGLIWLVMQSGTMGKRHGKSGMAEVRQQMQTKAPRAQSGNSNAAQD